MKSCYNIYMKVNYLFIPLFVIFISLFGSWLTSGGLDWYATINLPVWTPSGSFIGSMWTVIYILTAVSAVMVWNGFPRDSRFSAIIKLFLVNAFLNVLWSFIFFNQHLIGWATLEAGLLALSVFGLIFLIWPVSRIAASLLFLYAGWASFATYVSYSVWLLNR